MARQRKKSKSTTMEGAAAVVPAAGAGTDVERLKEALDREQAAAAPPESRKPATASLGQDPELLCEFVLEAREHLAAIEAELLTVERDPENRDSLNAIFRGFHTIKGLAGFLELTKIQEVAHEVETVLDRARNGEMALDPSSIDVVLESADYIRSGVDAVEAGLRGAEIVRMADPAVLLMRVRSVISAPAAQQSAPVPDGAAPDNAAPCAAVKGENKTPVARKSEAMAVRVDTSKLDYLVEMVGELVISQSTVRHDPELEKAKTPRLQKNLAQMARITAEVQKTAMAMRMVPIGQLFQRTARLVRDLCRKAGKQAELEMSGEETELDKTIVEELADPLLHMVRNAIDHGIEPPEERIAAGKPASGKIALRAAHRSGHVLVEIADDGRGIRREKILAKARQKGIVSDGSELSDAEVFNLIFEAGFSTAEQVSEVSGRGVGMDVVRKHIQKLRGRVEIQSTPGQGTTFVLKLPLTLAIIDGLVVGVGRERYVVPIFTVREMLRPGPDMLSSVQNQAEMALVRGQLVPIVRLARKFGIQPRSEDPCESLLIVIETDDKRFGLLVDDLLGKQEVVIKSLGETLKDTPGVAGGAILGDGRVGLILDMDSIFQ